MLKFNSFEEISQYKINKTYVFDLGNYDFHKIYNEKELERLYKEYGQEYVHYVEHVEPSPLYETEVLCTTTGQMTKCRYYGMEGSEKYDLYKCYYKNKIKIKYYIYDGRYWYLGIENEDYDEDGEINRL